MKRLSNRLDQVFLVTIVAAFLFLQRQQPTIHIYALTPTTSSNPKHVNGTTRHLPPTLSASHQHHVLPSTNKNDASKESIHKQQQFMYPFRAPNHQDSLAKDASQRPISPMESHIRKVAMITYIASMCIALPVTLAPIWLVSKTQLVDKTTTEIWAHDVAQACARFLLTIIPFCEITVLTDHQSDDLKNIRDDKNKEGAENEPTIWVCNHTSMLDTFILLASDYYLRGPNKRPIKVIYWKGLEDNPVINLMFKLCGFIPVQMAANGSGNPNEYDKASFLNLLRKTKQTFEEGFDILVLPEGQLNPWPEKGLLEVFPGAHKLSLTSHRPIRMVALHGFHHFWHADESIGMKVTARGGTVRAYTNKNGFMFDTSEEFVETFRTVVGHFGAHGTDHPDLANWMNGLAWKTKQQRRNQGSRLEVRSGENQTEIQDKPIQELESNHNGPFQGLENNNESFADNATGGVEQAILEIIGRENLSSDLDQQDLDLTKPQSVPVGVRMCKPPPTRISLFP